MICDTVCTRSIKMHEQMQNHLNLHSNLIKWSIFMRTPNDWLKTSRLPWNSCLPFYSHGAWHRYAAVYWFCKLNGWAQNENPIAALWTDREFHNNFFFFCNFRNVTQIALCCYSDAIKCLLRFQSFSSVVNLAIDWADRLIKSIRTFVDCIGTNFRHSSGSWYPSSWLVRRNRPISTFSELFRAHAKISKEFALFFFIFFVQIK